jgi:Ca2+-transporting ATPase
LYQQKVIVANPMTVETLGAATVICTDKTGTLTTDQMQLAAVYEFATKKSTEFLNAPFEASNTLSAAMWASESVPFDAMEIALHAAYGKSATDDLRSKYKMVKEYPLGGKPPMMTHVFSNAQDLIVAVKGSVEAVLLHSNATEELKKHINTQAETYANNGYRVLGVGQAKLSFDQLPEKQEAIKFEFLGLVAFYDPPKENIKSLLQTFYKAGIAVKMITGDHPQTALSIAKQIGLKNSDKALTGEEVTKMSATELTRAISATSVFARMFPEAKLKVVEALKSSGEIVAMTGDGVNDGPALKAAHIGIAMGLRGSEVAKRTASLVLMDDDLSHMAEAIESGRRIYSNLKKAILYIVSIHIPVILLVTVPVLLNWKFSLLFNPIHVIFLELVMGPTCSIVFERELGNADAMALPPRKHNESLFSSKEFLMSASQGLIITILCVVNAWYNMKAGESIELVRSKVFVILIFSNVLLTLGSRSFEHSIFYSLKRPNALMPIVLGLSLFLLILIFTWPFLLHLFAFTTLDVKSILWCLLMALSGSAVIELYKWIKRSQPKFQSPNVKF